MAVSEYPIYRKPKSWVYNTIPTSLSDLSHFYLFGGGNLTFSTHLLKMFT